MAETNALTGSFQKGPILFRDTKSLPPKAAETERVGGSGTFKCGPGGCGQVQIIAKASIMCFMLLAFLKHPTQHNASNKIANRNLLASGETIATPGDFSDA